MIAAGLIGFVLIKMIAMSLLYATAYLWEGAHRWLIPILMTIAGVWLTTQNTHVYLSLTYQGHEPGPALAYTRSTSFG